MARLQEYFDKTIVPQLQEQLGVKNALAVPRITKITLNMGVGEAINDKKIIDKAMQDLTMISGQKPVPTKARKSVATFKIRQGQLIGCKVTLRRVRMYEFLDRPFDGQGNYSIGIQEQIIFPEIDYNQIDAVRGLDITITTSAHSDAHARALLEAFNFPFRK
jgi:large subunit ribosomal protein L5